MSVTTKCGSNSPTKLSCAGIRRRLLAHSEEPPATGVAWTSGQVRRLCHLRLTKLPRATLALYRQRVDAEAKALLAQGKQTRSPMPLRRLVDDLFCSSVTDQALDLLGDLAFERGDFEGARHWWSVLAPIESPRPNDLRYPDPKVDLIRVQAKQVLAKLFQGRLNEARDAIQHLQDAHPDAKGDLAGRTGRYATILGETLTQFAAKRISNNDESWPTFGGAVTRNRVLSQAPSWTLLGTAPPGASNSRPDENRQTVAHRSRHVDAQCRVSSDYRAGPSLDRGSSLRRQLSSNVRQGALSLRSENRGSERSWSRHR